MDAVALQYRTSLCVAGQWFACVEDYEAVFSRLRDAQLNVSHDEAQESSQMSWLPPIELTIRGAFAEGESPKPLQAAISPMAIGMVYEIPEEWRENVE